MPPARYSGSFCRRRRSILHRGASPPPNSGVPRLVSFVNVYFNQLLEDEDFKPTMIQFLEIHQNWRHQRFREGILREELCNVMEAIRLNIDAWSKAYGDTSLSYIFLMNHHSHLYKSLKGTSLRDLVGESQLRDVDLLEGELGIPSNLIIR